MMKVYNQAPLPFMGQKRKFLKDFKAALKQYPHNATYVDMFGGSGLLSHTVKQFYPDAVVVYNDYDNYIQRIKAIPKTNKLITELRLILEDYPKEKRITGIHRDTVLTRIAKEKGFVDYITISSSLLFSMNYATSFEDLSKQALYNCVRLSDYNADGYLEGVQVVRVDYKKLVAQLKGKSNIIYLVDPPYLSTESNTYGNNGYWKLSDYLDVLDVLHHPEYFYFTSNKSSIVELCEWMGTRSNFDNPFKNAIQKSINTTMNYSSSYTDMMLYRYVSNSTL